MTRGRVEAIVLIKMVVVVTVAVAVIHEFMVVIFVVTVGTVVEKL
jgi:hypothetical protein